MTLTDAQTRKMKSIRAQVRHGHQGSEFLFFKRDANTLVNAGLAEFREVCGELLTHETHEWGSVASVRFVIILTDKGHQWLKENPSPNANQ